MIIAKQKYHNYVSSLLIYVVVSILKTVYKIELICLDTAKFVIKVSIITTLHDYYFSLL